MSEKSLIPMLAVVVGIGALAVSASLAWSYEVIEVKDGGKISGEVKFGGEVPPPEKLTVNKDMEVCGKTEKVNETLLIGANHGIQNVVVSISDIQKGKALGDGGVLDQKECIYTPHVVLSPARKELTIVNSDGILHNIHTYSEKNPSFNKAQPKFKKEMKETFIHPETIKVACDVHGWMSGWVVVHNHPYYAVTDGQGVFTIADVPPGEYELQFWHETLGETTQKVTVRANEEAKVSVTMTRK
jgi:hypothetical protein